MTRSTHPPPSLSQCPLSPTRPLNPFLMIAIIAVPVPLVLGLLWPGHARSTRVAGFVYAGAHVLLAVVAIIATAFG